MSFSKDQLNETLKLAKEKERLNEIKVSSSGASIYLGGDKITDSFYAKKRLEEEKKNKK